MKVFRQWFDGESSTYSYLLGDSFSKEAVIIDPVITQRERDSQFIKELGLKLKYAIDTHVPPKSKRPCPGTCVAGFPRN